MVSDGQWATFCTEFGLDELKADPLLQSNRSRVDNRDRYMPRLRALLATRDKADLLATAERLGLPFAPINRPQDMFDDPHLNHPGAMVEVTLSDGRKARVPALPLEWGEERFGLRLDIPAAGEHSRAIAAELGYAPAEIDALIAGGKLQG